MVKDRLYLLENEFADPDMPGRSFYCRDCIALNGILAAFPDCGHDLEVIRVAFPRPRAAVIDAIGVDNQWLPVLVFVGDAPAELADRTHEGTHFVTDMPRLLHALHVRHGFPEAHP
ncbi:MAG TPA: DUF3088 family protein [Sphingomonas sp.]|uniref:DUF3088 family protein n=1 Tax=Sphingomonas sp. TaxID=28214 RepID=UPI002CD70AE4|nr:DUF3088 family protein [Sphingomonas sp.]HMI20976.1 DUF3088 family protein [Sphingomonas sp.]